MGKGLCLGLVAALILSFHRAGIRHSGRSVFWVALTEPAFLFRPRMKAVHHGLIAVSVAAIILTSCNQDSGISDQQISDYIKTQIPPYLTVKSVTLERVTASPSGIAVQVYNFKVAATPAEPLLVSTAFDLTAKQDLISKGLKETPSGNQLFSSRAYDFKELDQIEYLKQVNQTSDTITIYGTVGARKMVDKVEFGAFTVASGLGNLGKPKGSFPPSSLIVGSAAYEGALNGVVKSQKEELAKAQAAEAEKRASDAAMLAAKQADESKRKRELLAATVSGARYRGTWFVQSSSKIIDLEFTDQEMDGRILHAKFTLTDDPSQVLEYEGYLEPSNSQNDSRGPVRLHFVRGTGKQTDWGASYSNLFNQFAEFDFELMGDRLIHRGQGAADLKIELSRSQSSSSPNSAVENGSNAVQSEIDQIRTRTSQILERLHDPSTTQEQKGALRKEASKLADRLDAMLGKKGQ
jgi:hypothetical protein